MDVLKKMLNELLPGYQKNFYEQCSSNPQQALAHLSSALRSHNSVC